MESCVLSGQEMPRLRPFGRAQRCSTSCHFLVPAAAPTHHCRHPDSHPLCGQARQRQLPRDNLGRLRKSHRREAKHRNAAWNQQRPVCPSPPRAPLSDAGHAKDRLLNNISPDTHTHTTTHTHRHTDRRRRRCKRFDVLLVRCWQTSRACVVISGVLHILLIWAEKRNRPGANFVFLDDGSEEGCVTTRSALFATPCRKLSLHSSTAQSTQQTAQDNRAREGVAPRSKGDDNAEIHLPRGVEDNERRLVACSRTRACPFALKLTKQEERHGPLWLLESERGERLGPQTHAAAKQHRHALCGAPVAMSSSSIYKLPKSKTSHANQT
jgi:hypothetical protein